MEGPAAVLARGEGGAQFWSKCGLALRYSEPVCDTTPLSCRELPMTVELASDRRPPGPGTVCRLTSFGQGPRCLCREQSVVGTGPWQSGCGASCSRRSNLRPAVLTAPRE